MGNGDGNSEVIVAIVALVISVIALTATFIQVSQQYLASAAGYAQLNDKVMGEWAKTKKRVPLLSELRLEVQFDAPVIFVTWPENTRKGPIPNSPIYFLNGTESSLADTWTRLAADEFKRDIQKTEKEKIHTADNERASWSILLSAIQQMECDSKKRRAELCNDMGPPSTWNSTPSSGSERDIGSLMVALQRKRKSWDTMPASVSRPYATTTMCHLIEMMAMLGLYWKEFDRKHDRYRAEGNGFMVIGEKVSDLGIGFSFQVYGKANFASNRVIPVDEVKELCFGYVPTIYRATLDRRRLDSPNFEPQNLGSLQMSSREEVSETLLLIGCNNNTIRYFKEEGKRTSHLFPVSFEILGMLSKTFHIVDTPFTYIPNPTMDRWDKRSLSLVKILESFKLLLNHEPLPSSHSRNPRIFALLNERINEIMEYRGESLTWVSGSPAAHGTESHFSRVEESVGAEKRADARRELLGLRALHEALDDTDKILIARSGAIDGQETAKQRLRREDVQDVLRSHVQHVLKYLNERDDLEQDPGYLPAPDSVHPGEEHDWTGAAQRSQPPQFSDMDAAGPDDKQQRFMEVYFRVIRQRVVNYAMATTKNRRESIVAYSSTGAEGATCAMEMDAGRGDDPRQDPAVRGDLLHEERGVVEEKIGLEEEKISHDDIWCTLVFRMICWLMLHDFNKQDVQLSKSELLGSRMPVYVL